MSKYKKVYATKIDFRLLRYVIQKMQQKSI